MVKVFDIIVEKGEKKHSQVFVGQLAHGAKVYIPVLIICGKEAGPTLWINGAIHGDELNGPLASWELFHKLSPNDIKGKVIITPISNPLAFENRDKISDIDLLDMDTAFPGDSEGAFTQRIAKMLFDEIEKHADYLVHFHTLHSYFKAIPYTVSKIVPHAKQEVIDKAREMALAFGVETNCVVDLANATGEMPGVTNGALDITCIQKGIPAFLAEVGSGGKIDRHYVSIAESGVMNLLYYLGLMEGERNKPDMQRVITKRKFLRSEHGGFLTMNAEPGDILSSGEKLAESHNFGTEINTVNLNDNAYIIATRENPVVNTGDRLAFIGTEWTEMK